MFNPGDLVKGKYKYKIIKHLNTGQYAEAYQAQDHKKNTVFLKKYTDPSMLFTPWVNKYIDYQNRIVYLLGNAPLRDFVVNILDVFVFDSFYIQVHEWSPYSDLKTYISSRSPGAVGTEQDLAIAQTMMYAMHLLHQSGVIHADLKPENVMMKNDSSGRLMPRLCDFDWSLHATEYPPWEGGVRGTPFYMSYEHIFGTTVQSPSDVYTCGIILYQLLTGKHPIVELLPVGKNPGDFTAKELNLYLKSKLQNHSAIPRPSTLTHSWSYNQRINDILHQCLHPIPANRPSAKQVYEVLQSKAFYLYLNHKNGFQLITTRKDVERGTSYIGRERCRLFGNHEYISRLQAWLMPSQDYSKWFVMPPKNKPTNILTVQYPGEKEEQLDNRHIELISDSIVRIRGSHDYSNILCELKVEFKPE